MTRSVLRLGAGAVALGWMLPLTGDGGAPLVVPVIVPCCTALAAELRAMVRCGWTDPGGTEAFACGVYEPPHRPPTGRRDEVKPCGCCPAGVVRFAAVTAA